MKTLYLTDLDGTLLNSHAELSEYTIDTLNGLIAQGIHISVATARTVATAVEMLKEVTVKIPIILMNGVLIYDIQKERYVKMERLPSDGVTQILNVLKRMCLTGFMYTIRQEKLVTYYENLDSKARRNFVNERVRKYNKSFTQVDSFMDAVDSGIIYFAFLDESGNIHRLHDSIKNIDGLHIEMYKDIYSEDLWYLEVFSVAASKYNAVQFMRLQYGFERIIGFGDNLNDIPLFNACDECYAVANAKPELKEIATAVIGGNDEDGVAKWMEADVYNI